MFLFSTATIFNFKIILPKHHAQKVVLALQKEGVCQLKECEEKLGEKMELPYSEEVFSVSNKLETIKSLMKKFLPETSTATEIKGLFSKHEKKKIEIDLLSTKEIIKKSRVFLMKVSSEIEPKISLLEELSEELRKTKDFIDKLWFFPNKKTSIFSSTENIECVTGFVEAKKVEVLSKKVEGCVLAVSEKGKKTKAIAVYYLPTNHQKTMSILHETGFERFVFPETKSKTINELVQELEQKKKRLLEKTNKIKQELMLISKNNWKELLRFEKAVKAALDRIREFKKFSAGKLVSLFEAWIPEKNEKRFIKVLNKNTVYYIESREKSNAPTIFENPKIFQPFELLTEMYSPPKYKRVDPTPLLAVFFSLFFGFMLTDFFYGVSLALIGFMLYRGKGQIDTTIKKLGLILVWAGLATALLGIFFGSYFGNFFSRIGFKIPAVIDTMKDAIVVMAISLGLAIIHLFIGLVIGFYENIRKKDLLEALRTQGTWISFIAGIIAFLLPTNYSFEIGLFFIALSVLLLIGITLKKEGAILAVMSIFDFPGFLGDVFSYTRLTALAIATSGIALVVNFLVSFGTGVPYIGIIAGGIIFFIGHSVNFAINFLGSFIHSLRLNFLEFFKNFYEGGGKLYKPFKIKEFDSEV